LLSRRLVVATTTKQNLGHLAPASEVAGRHTLPFLKGHGLPILKRYVLLRYNQLVIQATQRPTNLIIKGDCIGLKTFF
jgi:hypothetical protein